jgi:hypothetical protein
MRGRRGPRSTVEVWEAINRAWLIIRDRTKPAASSRASI